MAVLADAPPLMGEGNWRVGVLMDAAASQEQAEALGAVFSGQRGGRRHSVRVGEAIQIEVEDFVSRLDPTGEGVKVSGVGFPADTLAAGTATTSRVNVFGLQWSNEGKNSFSAPFSWSA